MTQRLSCRQNIRDSNYLDVGEAAYEAASIEREKKGRCKLLWL